MYLGTVPPVPGKVSRSRSLSRPAEQRLLFAPRTATPGPQRAATSTQRPALRLTRNGRAAPIIDRLLRHASADGSRSSRSRGVAGPPTTRQVAERAVQHADRPCESWAELLRGADHRSPAARLDCLDVASAAGGGGRTPTSFRSAWLVVESTLRWRPCRLAVSPGGRRPWIEVNLVEEFETGNRRRIAVGVDWRRSLAANQPDSRKLPKERSFSANSASIGVVGGGIDSTAAAASFGGVSGKTPALDRGEFSRRRRDEKSTQNRRGSRLAAFFGGESASTPRNAAIRGNPVVLG